MSNPSVWPQVGPATLASLLRSRAAGQGEKTAFVFLADGEVEGGHLTYGELDGRARAVASALRESLAPGDRALLLYPPGLEFIVAFLGCLYAGVIAVPAYPPRFRDRPGSRSQERLSAIVRDAGPRAALTTASILAALSETSSVPELAAARWIATDVLEGLEGSRAEIPEPDPESVAFLQYTSGSTSTPKGVMVTHANLLHNERMIGEAFRQDESSVVVGWLPLYHDMGLIGNVLQPLHAGGSCVLMAPVAFLQKPLRWLQAIGRFRGTTSGGPNFAYELCLRRIGEEERAGLDLSSWRLAYNGAEPVRAETLERFAEAFAPCGFRPEAFYPCFGLAEATLFVSGGTAGRIPRVAQVDAAALERNEARPVGDGAEERRLVSCGRAWAGQRIAVVDPESGEELPAGRVGEIWVAGPSVARGYWRNPEATARDFQARLAAGEGTYLRTGDLGFLRDGELYVTGRIKDLVIIRGRNHYPQDIELTAERSHPDLRPGGGAAFSVEVGGEERLVVVQEVERRRRASPPSEGGAGGGWIGSTFEEVAEAVRRAVAEEHEVQVHEVVLVRVGTVPKTSSGKIRRRASRSLYLAGGLEVVGRSALPVDLAEPGAPLVPSRQSLAALEPAERLAVVERFLRERAAAAVIVPAAAIDPQRPLTGLGIDSLSAIELKSAVEAALGVPLPLADLLEGAGTAELAAALLSALEGEAVKGPALRPGGAELGVQPLSFGQKALWFIDRLAPEGGAYNVAVAARARGLDPAALRRALTALALRHPALRSVFPVVAGEPVRRVLDDPGRIDFAVEDAAAWSEERLSRRLADEAYRPFDLGRGPLLRVRAFERGDGEHALLLAVHHIAVDFASLAVVARDLAALYQQEPELEPLPFGYSDFVRWQDEMLAGPRGARLEEHWREALAGLPDLDLPTDRPRPPVQTYRGGARALELPPDLADGIRELISNGAAGQEAAGRGATLFMALLAVFQAQLARYTGQRDFAVGSPVAARPPELAGAVGYFVNPVALRADLAGDPSLAELLNRVRRTVLSGLEHGDFPFALLAERLRPVRDPARTPLFQVMFLLQRDRQGNPGILPFALGEAGGKLTLGGMELKSLRLEERRAQFDLALRAAEEAGGRIRMSLELNVDLFDAATAERMLGHFQTLLAGALADPAARLAELPLLTAGERAVLLAFGRTEGLAAEPVLIHELFAERARLAPDAAALAAEGEVLSYAELDAGAEALARRLRELGVGPEVRVAAALERSPDLIVALLAVLKAGGAWLPIDPAYPEERIELLLADSGARVLLRGGLTPRPTSPPRSPSLPRPSAGRFPTPGRGGRATGRPDPRNLAYVLYTSGSTGRPKGVAVDHATAASHFRSVIEAYGFGPGARILFFASPSFDVALEQVLPGLLAGATIVLRGRDLWEPADLARRIEELGLTFVNLPTAYWSRWAWEAADLAAAPASLRCVLVGGEEMPAESVRRWRRSALAGVRLLNGYGPTETVVTATLHEVSGDGPGPVSIGRPLPGRSAHVVDRHGELLPAGARGELALGGVVARGYLGAPDRTAERFVPDPFGNPTDRTDPTDRGGRRVSPPLGEGLGEGRSDQLGARLYRTGDLVRRRADGSLEFLGRIDTQLKVRGFRVEPGEIEAALLQHRDVREAVVLLHGEALAAWLVLEPRSDPHSPRSFRDFLSGKLPAWMIPASYTLLAALPLTPHGKIDRRALPQPSAAGAGEGWTAPRTALEEAVAAVWAPMLGVERVGVHDDFFHLGGHSLLATRVAAQLREVLGVELPVTALFQAPTVAALAGQIAETAANEWTTAVSPPVVPVLRPDERRVDLPLSFAQQRLWFLDRLRPGGAAYNMPGAAELAGALDAAALSAALSEIVRRHEALRTCFVVHGGQPVQVIDPPVPTVLEVVDLAALAEPEREAGARMAAEAARPFDLGRGPLLRAILLRLAPERHRLLLTLHHMVADGWSLGILLGELAALYGAFTAGRPSPLAELPVQYADFAVWQRRWLAGEALERQLAWWKDELAGAPAILDLPADRPRPAVRTERGAVVRTAIPAALADGVRELARRHGATPFTGLLAAFQTLLLRITGQEDLLVGSAVAGRTRPEVERLIGFFANTLVLRGALAGDPAFLEALAQARQRTAGAWAHQDLPVERLIEALHPGREPGITPLFQAVFVLQSAPADLELPGLTVRRLPVASGAAKFDLTLELTEQEEGLAAAWELSRDLFDEATVERLAGWFSHLLEGAVEAPERRLSELPLLGAAELRQLLVEQNPAPTTAPLDVPVHRLFEEQAVRGPQRIALVQEDRELTYAELNARANRLARRLIAEGVGPETLVGVLLERSFEMIETFLAVLKAGGAYVPLDPAWPRERLADLIEEAGIRLVLTRERVQAVAPQPAGDLPDPGIGRLAYAMFTSGSTGRPKTVGIEHRSIVRLVRDADFAGFGPEHVFLQLAPPAFDAATLEVWGALLHGARLVLAPPAAPSLDELGAILARHGVTTLWLTAGLFHQMVESRIGSLRGVRQLLAGGDVLSPAAVNRVLAELPEARLINGYGPTENTTFTCCHTVAGPIPPERTVPIGRPIRGTRVYVVDRWLQPVPALVPGELLAGGEGLARGYLGRPELTAERFVPDPFAEDGRKNSPPLGEGLGEGRSDQPGHRLYRTGDLVRRLPSGEIEFLGRIDRQVKIRGFRVEPGEIEAALAAHPAVAQAAVLVREPEPGDRRLVACVVPAGAGGLPLAELRAWLGERLPAYLIPDLVALPELPLTANGKVDRQALERIAPEPGAGTWEREAFDAPRTPVEEILAGIWAEVLDVERVGVHDNFFELGGHSLLATRVVSRIVDTLHVDLPLAAFFEAPTVAGLAGGLSGASVRPDAPPLVPVPRDAPLPLSFAQQRLWFLDRLVGGGSAYNLAVAALLDGDLDVDALERGLGEIVRRHEALRTVFSEIDGRPVQIVRPWEAPALERRALPGLEEARVEAACGAARPFDLTAGPVVRFSLMTLGPPLENRKHLLAATFHHIAADGWSLQVFLRELAELYGAFAAGRMPKLAEPPVQYADYAVWQREALTDQALAPPLAFWRRRLAGIEPIELPADGPRTPAATAPVRTRPLDLPADLAVRMAACARGAGATSFMVLLAGLYTLLARLTGQLDLTVGAPVAARRRVEIEGIIGFFANTLPLRADLGGDPSFRELVARVRSVVLEAHAHGDVPFERLVEELQPDRAPGRNPLFDIALTWMSAPARWTDIPGLAMTPVDLPGSEAKFDLSFTVHERAGLLSGTVEGRGDLFEEATLGRMAAWLRILLAGALDDPEARLSALPFLTEAERAGLLAAGRTEGGEGEPLLVHTLFEERVRLAPEAPALEMDGEVLSYAELNARADRLAGRLRALGVGPEDRVAVALERSPELVVSLLAVLKAGGAYLPIDPADPRERVELLLADSGARVLVRGDLTPCPLLPSPHQPGAPSPASGRLDPRNLAYVIYTSGSTGRPKGVAVEHGMAAAHFRTVIQAYGLGPGERVLFFAAPSFDMSLEQILPGLLAGATLVLRGRDLWETAELAGRIEQLGLTVVNLPTAYWSRWVWEAADLPAAPASLRLVLVGGEEMPAESARRWRQSPALAPIDLRNAYGPTESVVTATLHEVGGEVPGPVPIGRPLPGRAAWVIDADGGLLPDGARGELALGGVLARGYLGAPDRTAERFVPDPFGDWTDRPDRGNRLYRTGDLVRRRADSDLEFLGRIGHQVKIRGFRVEAGEIEAALAAHPDVREAVVLAHGDASGDRHLAAWIVLDPESEIQSPTAVFRAFLAGRLPAWMIPSSYTLLPALPLTQHGKVDRRALPRPSIAFAEEGWTAPRNALEEGLAAVWTQVLGVGRVGAHDDFFHLGGHSLLAARLAARVRAAFGVELPLAEMFAAPTLTGMAERLAAARSTGEAAAPPLVRRPHPGAETPLSFAQQRLWFLAQLEPGSAAYNVPGALRLSGFLRVEALAGALAGIVRRHEVLRTVFQDSGGAPVQIVLPPGGPSLPVVDLAGLPAAVREAEGLARIGEEAARPFDLERGAPVRVALLRLSAEDHLLPVVMHHIASDAWSLRILLRELPALYAAGLEGAPSPLPELPVQYADFALWQRRWLAGDVLERELAPWRRTLAGAPSSLALPTDRPRPATPTYRGLRRPFHLPAAETGALQELARREGWTFFMLLLAAFQALLSRLSGQEDVIVGSPIANRTRLETEGLVGFFTNTLALRLDLAGDPPFLELGRRARAAALDGYTHQNLPFEKLVEDLAPERHLGRNPLFQTLLVVQREPEPPALPGLRARLLDADPGIAKLDLTLMLTEETGGVSGFLEHSRDLFDAATADRMSRCFRTLLAGAAADPGARLSELPLLTAAERDELLAWGRPPGPRGRPELAHERVAAQAARTPEATAVELGGERLTYRELLARARGLAHRLAALGVGPDVPVGIFLERSLDQMVAVLAVLEAGGAYLPLDPRYPAERLRLMIEDAGAPVVLTQTSLAGALLPGAGRPLLLDGAEAPWPTSIEGEELPPVTSGVTPDHLVYLIYTSGSTGRPKGVAMTHGAVSALLHWQVRASTVSAGRTLQSTTLSFDVSFQEIFSTWWAGGTLVLVSEEVRRDPAALLAWLDAQRVERLFLPFVALQQLAVAAADAEAPGSLREILSAGEQLFVTPQVASLLARCPGAVLQNHYGPTETHVVTWLSLEGDPAGWPRRPAIGRPLDHAQILLLDAGLRPVAVGMIGEVFAGGTGLARGYLGRPDLTAERFMPDPFAGEPGNRMYRTGDLGRWRPDGLLEYVGRGDSQVKVRGHRIELHEVEMALARHPAVAQAAVAVRGAGDGTQRLAACVVLRDGGPAPGFSELRRFLAETLPDSLIPSVWARVESLPRTPSGKLDRRALERLEPEEDRGSGGARVPPRTPAEELLAALWCEVLEIERVGVHDSFFELGGHSLLATRLVSRVRAAFGRDLQLARLFETPTIAGLARLLGEARGGPGEAPIQRVPRQGDLPLSFSQERLWFLDRIQPGVAYSVPLALRLRGPLDAGRLGRAFGSVVARQEALRTVFVERDGEPAQRILPAAPAEAWPLPVADLAGLAGERAEAVAAALAREDALRPFDLAAGPLLRTTLLRLGAADHVLLLNMHHVVSDGWSLGVLLNELAAFYGGRPERLPELPVQYADFAVWQRSWLRGDELERQAAYWREQLAGAPAGLDLPSDRPRPLVSTTNGAHRPVTLDAGLAARLAALARRQGATPFMLLLAAFMTLLHRFSRQADLNVGTPIAGRNRSEIEHLVGFFVNTLVMRADLADDPPFPDLLARLRRTALAAYDHQDLPFEKLVDELQPERDTSRHPLFQVIFALQNAPLGSLELPGLTLEPTAPGAAVAKFDLTLILFELNGTLTGGLDYNTDLFDSTTAARLAAQWNVLLEGIAAQPGLRIGELPLLTAGERHQLLVEWAAAGPEPRGRLLHALVERHADATPEAPAVEQGETRWSYGELERRANRLAWFLRELGVGPETRVALCVERSIEAVAAMLGVLKAGGAYLPLDPAYPRERLALMLEDGGARVLLTEERLLGRLPETGAAVVCLDRDGVAIARRPPGRPASGVTGLNAAYVIYTSGSTGRPKGVLVPHECVAAYSEARAGVYGAGPGDRSFLISSISFDASIEEIYIPLTRGATLVVRGEVQEGISDLLERCRAERITQLKHPTALWNQLTTAMEVEDLRLPEGLRLAFVYGEKMLAQRLVSWWHLVPPGFRLLNGYGPTETTVVAVLCPIPDAVEVHAELREVPIGRPLSHVRAYVFDRGLRPVPVGVIGELFLGGTGVSRGYLGRPELTAERFIPNPHAHVWGDPGERLYRTGDLVRLLPDGLLEFVGRTDHQVKIRGYRIEPGEIEAVLAAHPDLGETVVLTRQDPAGDVQLSAYAAVKGETAPAPAELRAWLAERLPSYMMPAAIQVLPSLPVNTQGKVDRRALERLAPRSIRSAQAGERTASAAPRNEMEAAIATVWREVFGVDQSDPAEAAGIHDNFFEAGGSSLLLVKLHSRLQKALGRSFPLVEIFKHPTIAALAASLGAGAPARPSHDKARARTETRRESMRQVQQLREQRRRGR